MTVYGARANKWTTEEDQFIVDTLFKAHINGIGREAAFLAASEQLDTRTVKAIGERYYKMRREGNVPPELLEKTIVLKRDSDLNESEEPDAMDLISMFGEMKKIIRERDELRARYEDAMTYKAQYEEIKKKLAKIERESASFMELLRRRS
jgi:hypothetical protein